MSLADRAFVVLVCTYQAVSKAFKDCTMCPMERSNTVEPMRPSDPIMIYRQKVGTDVFYFTKATHLLVVNYYSSYVEIARPNDADSSDVILHLKSLLRAAWHPEDVGV